MTYDFHTAEIDGVEVAGVAFSATDGAFYEFQDPDSHDNWQRLVCPRSGDTITHSSRVEQMMGEILGGAIRATVPAEKWAEFRDDYVNAEDDDYERWADAWREMSHADPREDGGVVKCNNCSEQFWSENESPLGPTCPECGHPANDPKVTTDGTR